MFKNSNQFRRRPFHRFSRATSERLRRWYGACADWITSKTIGSSFFRRSSQKQRYATWKLTVWMDEARLKATTLIRRKSAPGRKAKSKVMAAVEGFCNAWIVPILRAVTKPFRWAAQTAISFIERVFERAASDPRLRYLVLPFQFLYRIAAAFADFVVAWFGTRNYRALLLGLPAIVLLLPLMVCLIRIPLHGAHGKARHYQQAAFDAIRDKEFEKADLLFRKLQQLGVDRPSVVYSEATVMAEKGETTAAYEKMQSIAPLDAGGFAPAHFWIAKAIYGEVVEVPEAERLVLMKGHLHHVLDQYPGDPLATQLLADVEWQAGQQDQAVTTIGSVTGARLSPGSQANMARTFSRWGKTEKARQFATLAVNGYQSKIDEIDTFTRGDFLLWTAATELADLDDQTMQVLILTLEHLEPEATLLQFVRGMSCGVLDANWLGGSGDRERWLELARLALSIEPIREAVLDNVAGRAAATGQDQRADLAERIRQMALDAGELTPRSHQLLADLALKAGDHLEAREGYLALINNDDQNLKAFNNLAWLFANVDPTDLSRAIDYANKAVNLAPGDAAVLETRGQILVQLQRWDDAVIDLEQALNGIPNHIPIHDSLAICYERSGRPELAAAHRQRAEALRSEQQ